MRLFYAQPRAISLNLLNLPRSPSISAISLGRRTSLPELTLKKITLSHPTPPISGRGCARLPKLPAGARGVGLVSSGRPAPNLAGATNLIQMLARSWGPNRFAKRPRPQASRTHPRSASPIRYTPFARRLHLRASRPPPHPCLRPTHAPSIGCRPLTPRPQVEAVEAVDGQSPPHHKPHQIRQLKRTNRLCGLRSEGFGGVDATNQSQVQTSHPNTGAPSQVEAVKASEGSTGRSRPLRFTYALLLKVSLNYTDNYLLLYYNFIILLLIYYTTTHS